jgi:predicted aspartyl protease
MRIEGRWLAGADGVERPVFDGFIAAPGGVQLAISLLIDTGADLTVLAPAVAEQLADSIRPTLTETVVGGVGGTQRVYELAVDLLLPTTTGQRARIRGPLPVIVEPGSLELSVVGRNLLDQFTLIYSRPRNVLQLLTPPDSFTLM